MSPAQTHASSDRLFDWAMACLLLTFGLASIVLPNASASPQYAGFIGNGIGPQALGLFMVSLGGVWAVFLWLNGSWRPSPFPRLACAICSAGVWGGIEAGFCTSAPSTGTATYGVIMVFSICACARCGGDAIAALHTMRRARQGERHAVDA
jgi:hypothetical protein